LLREDHVARRSATGAGGCKVEEVIRGGGGSMEERDGCRRLQGGGGC